MHPNEVIQEAQRTGYYRSMKTGSLFAGQRWVEDQMTGLGHVEGSLTGDVIGCLATIEMWNGYKASLYMTLEEIEAKTKKCNPENYVLSMLIKNKALQAYQGEIKHEPELSNY